MPPVLDEPEDEAVEVGEPVSAGDEAAEAALEVISGRMPERSPPLELESALAPAAEDAEMAGLAAGKLLAEAWLAAAAAAGTGLAAGDAAAAGLAEVSGAPAAEEADDWPALITELSGLLSLLSLLSLLMLWLLLLVSAAAAGEAAGACCSAEDARTAGAEPATAAELGVPAGLARTPAPCNSRTGRRVVEARIFA